MATKSMQSIKQVQYEKMENSFWKTVGLEEKDKGYIAWR